MNWKTWAPLVLAVALGLVAMKVARDVMSKNQPTGNTSGNSQMVVVKHDVAAGAELTADDLEVAKVTAQVSPQSVFTDPAAAQGRVLNMPIIKGSPIVEAMLTPTGKGTGLQALIPDGMRAITVEINEITGVAGNLTPGSRIDFLSTINSAGGEMISRVIVQNIKVQALGGARQAAGDNPGPTRSVTLLATPKEAEAIELACATGKPRLLLRSGSDNDLPLSEGVTIAELKGGISGDSDPFQQPIQNVTLIKSGDNILPSTQPTPEVKPVSDTTPTPRSWRRSRQVKIIRGGVESEIIVEESSSPVGGRWITNAGTDEVQGNQ